MCPN
jgi:hypothetical protein